PIWQHLGRRQAAAGPGVGPAPGRSATFEGDGRAERDGQCVPEGGGDPRPRPPPAATPARNPTSEVSLDFGAPRPGWSPSRPRALASGPGPQRGRNALASWQDLFDDHGFPGRHVLNDSRGLARDRRGAVVRSSDDRNYQPSG